MNELICDLKVAYLRTLYKIQKRKENDLNEMIDDIWEASYNEYLKNTSVYDCDEYEAIEYASSCIDDKLAEMMRCMRKQDEILHKIWEVNKQIRKHREEKKD